MQPRARRATTNDRARSLELLVAALLGGAVGRAMERPDPRRRAAGDIVPSRKSS